MPSFGTHTGRPGGEPPPRRQLTPEELRVRETFNRAEHLARNGAPAPVPQPAPTVEVKAFDEAAIRAALAQEGLDFTFSIFPIGEKPVDPQGHSQRLQARVTELENERTVIRNRMLVAEQAAADAIRDVKNITTERDTLRDELEALKLQAKPETAQEAV